VFGEGLADVGQQQADIGGGIVQVVIQVACGPARGSARRACAGIGGLFNPHAELKGPEGKQIAVKQVGGFDRLATDSQGGTCSEAPNRDGTSIHKDVGVSLGKLQVSQDQI